LPKLVNLGSLCTDHVYKVATLAGAGETRASTSHEIFPGGKGLNQSLAARKAGAEVHHVGCVGDDGGALLAVLENAGVEISGIRTIPGMVSGHAVIQVNDAGENAIVIAGGANRCLVDEDVEAAVSKLGSDDWLLLQNEINDLPRVLSRMADSAAKVAFNIAPVDGREQDYDLSAVDLLIVNEIESRALVSAEVATQGDSAVAADLAAHFPSMQVVLTSGSSGLVFASGREVERIPAFAVEPVDETAAGDAFIGYFLAELLAGRPMLDALRIGSAAGALAVTVAGAASSVPDRTSVMKLAG